MKVNVRVANRVITEVVEKEIEKTKFGVGIDNFIGDVDADGNYVAPSEPFEINLAGVKSVPTASFDFFLSGKRNYVFHADEVESIASYAFQNAFQIDFIQKTDDISITFNGVETINAYAAFMEACKQFNSTSPNSGKYSVVFSNLKKIEGDYAFQYFMQSETMEKFNQVFPLLEEIRGNYVFDSAFTKKDKGVYNFTNIKIINGYTSTYGSTFGSFYQKNTVWNFPSATEFTGYIWNGNASYPGEIHFAASNQAAIEACNGYANKWGFAGATIYFDL